MKNRKNSSVKLDSYASSVFKTILQYQDPNTGLVSDHVNGHAWIRDNVSIFDFIFDEILEGHTIFVRYTPSWGSGLLALPTKRVRITTKIAPRLTSLSAAASNV